MRSLYALLIALLVAFVSVSATSLDERMSSDKVILTTASGEQKEVTREELDAMQRQQQELQTRLQETKETDWVEDEDLDDLQRRDPALARSIRVASESFGVLQTHGYARGYALAGFTELDTVPITSKKAQAEGAKTEFRVTMQVRAKFDANAGVYANPGTSAAKRATEPQTLGYQVEALVDKDDVVSVVYAWLLRADGKKGKELTIKPSDALMARYAERRQSRQTGGGVMAVVGSYATWILSGGVTLIVIGVAMVFLAQKETPKAPKKEAPVTSPKKAKSIIEREAGEGWELANGK